MVQTGELLSSFPPQKVEGDEDYHTKVEGFIKQLDKLTSKELLKDAGTEKDLLNVRASSAALVTLEVWLMSNRS